MPSRTSKNWDLHTVMNDKTKTKPEDMTPEQAIKMVDQLVELGKKTKSITETFEGFVDDVMRMEIEDVVFKDSTLIVSIEKMLMYAFKYALRNRKDFILIVGNAPLRQSINAPEALNKFPLKTITNLDHHKGEEFKALMDLMHLMHKKFEQMDEDDKKRGQS